MEPRQSEKSVESHGEGQASPTRPPDRKPRFRIVKLEERIAPGRGGTTNGQGHHTHPKVNCYGGS
jgi:hypothetical protein